MPPSYHLPEKYNHLSWLSGTLPYHEQICQFEEGDIGIQPAAAIWDNNIFFVFRSLFQDNLDDQWWTYDYIDDKLDDGDDGDDGEEEDDNVHDHIPVVRCNCGCRSCCGWLRNPAPVGN